MKKKKVLLFTALILIAVGISLAAIGTAKGARWNWRFSFKDFKIISGSDNFITETQKLDAFDKIVVNTSTFDVNIIKGDEYSITYHVPDDEKPEIINKNGVLTVNLEQESNFTFLNIGFFNNDENAYINITVPDTDSTKAIDIESSTADIKIADLNIDGSISTSTGDINLDNNKMGNIKLTVSTGDIFINNCTLDTLETKSSTGETKINNTKIIGKYTAKTSTGDVDIFSSELGEFTLSGSTSDVTTKATSIGNIKIETSTGEVTLGLVGDENSYSMDIHTSTGDIRVGNEEFEDNYKKTVSGINSIDIDTSTGDVEIDFN
ncbi:MAG: DUF4097 domain-containing protein [Lachnospiraceae bacterium]|nr:DUF4097 domain-containing protein [Lachnospiraceae bacterium]